MKNERRRINRRINTDSIFQKRRNQQSNECLSKMEKSANHRHVGILFHSNNWNYPIWNFCPDLPIIGRSGESPNKWKNNRKCKNE